MTERPTKRAWRDWLRTNQGVGVVVLVMLAGLLAYLLSTSWVYVRLRDGIHLGFFPVVAVILMLLSAAGMILDRQRTEATTEMAESDWQTWVYPVLAIPILFLFFWAMAIAGFVLTAPLVLIPVIYLLGARPLRAAILASLLITVSVYAIFRVIGTNIPQGPMPI